MSDDDGLADVRRDSRLGLLLAWKWLFVVLFTVVGTLGTVAYLAYTGVIGANLTLHASVDASPHLSTLLWVVVGTIAVVSLVSVIRVAGIGFFNSLIDVLDSIRFER